MHLPKLPEVMMDIVVTMLEQMEAKQDDEEEEEEEETKRKLKMEEPHARMAHLLPSSPSG